MGAPEWFRSWVVGYTAKIKRTDWPPAGDPFWVEVGKMFTRYGITLEELDGSFVPIFEKQPQFLSDHPARLVQEALKYRRAKDAEVRVNDNRQLADDPQWEREALAHWAMLSDDDRKTWLTVVVSRFPQLSHYPGFVQKMAVGYAFQPSLVPPERPPAEQSKPGTKGPRRVIE
jgi:hypothetical protein